MTPTRTNPARRRLRRRQVLLAGVALAGATAFIGAQRDAPAEAALSTGYVQGPSGLAFYQPPGVLPADNGSIIWGRQSSFPARSDVSAKAWQILYKSTTATGKAVAVSGTVLVPDKPWTNPGPRPIIGWAPGSKGIGDACATSRNLANNGDYEVTPMQDALARGYALAITDYQGMGTPGDHPYAVGRALGPSVLDSIKAAYGLREAGLSKLAPIGLFGYSEGGLAANWAARLAPTYAPDIDRNIKGVAAGGTPNDLFAMARYVDGGALSGLQGMAAVGYQAAYAELKFEDKYDATGIFKLENNIASNQGNAVARTVRNNCLVPALAQTPFITRAQMVENGAEVLNMPTWKAKFEDNKLNAYTPTKPMFMWHGEWDTAVQFAQAKHLRNNFCDQGAKVHWVEVPGVEHVGGIFVANRQALDFLRDRFDDKAFTGNCSAYRF